MILIDAFIFISIVLLLHYYKLKHPNFLFFCKGSILFLPPEQQQVLAYQQSKKKEGQEISIVQVQYEYVKTYPFCTEFERIIMTVASLLGFYIFRLTLASILPEVSMLPFYVLLAILVYTIKVSVDIFMVSPYRNKVCFMVAFFINVFYLFLAITLNQMDGVYDTTIDFVSKDYAKHLQIVLGHSIINWINSYSVLCIVTFINFFITLATIPSVIKFGNWYSKTLKQVYYQQQNSQQKSARLLNTTKQSAQQTQKQLKQNSKHTISLLNYYLIATLVFLFLSHRYILQFVDEIIADVLRGVFLVVTVGIILWTLKDAIQWNGAFAYKHVQEYFEERSKEGRVMIRRKIVPYIGHLWYHMHQFLIRIIIPVLIAYLIIHWKYVATQQSSLFSQEQSQPNYDTQCLIKSDQLSLMKSLYKCPIRTYSQIEQEQVLTSSNLISGVLRAEPLIQPPSTLQKRVLSYGLIKSSFMLQVCQLLLWYSTITIYIMTVVYVLFLRKTVYEI